MVRINVMSEGDQYRTAFYSTLIFEYTSQTLRCSGNNQSVGSSAPVVSRWL